MSQVFCTISTNSHLYKAFALADSLPNYTLIILVIDFVNEKIELPKNVQFIKLDELESEISIAIIKKYTPQSDKLRWSLKPCFMLFLLKKYDKVVYVDNDIFFFNTPTFLFDYLENYSLLLTPHHYENNPLKKQNWLEATLKMGLYNAGFMGSNKTGVEALSWWAKCCLYRCEKNTWRGLWDDQKYLDLMPIAFSNVKVLTHKGCNVAEWNKIVCKRTLADDKILINNEYPIVFYHFNGFSIKGIVKDKNHILKGYFEQYFNTLKKYKHPLNFEELYYKTPCIDKIKLQIWQWLNTINDKTIRK